MRGKKLIALLLAAMMALAIVPMPALGYDVEQRIILGQWTNIFIWEEPATGGTCSCQYDYLPKGMAFYYEWDMSRSAYVYCVKGTPTQPGKYDVRFDFKPDGLQWSSVVIRFIVKPDGTDYYHFLRDEYKTSGTVGEYLWLRFPHSFNAADQIEVGVYYNPGADNADITAIGLKILPEGVLCGTPTKAGTYKFWIYANAKFDGEWYEDYAKVTVTIENAPTPAPTAAPTPKPTAAPTPVPSAERKAPDCVMEAVHDIRVNPGEEFEAVLFADAGSCAIDKLIDTGAPLPDTVKFENIDGKYVLHGVMPEEAFAEDYYVDEEGQPFNGVFTFYVIMSCDGLKYCVRYRVLRDAHELYPEAVPMTGFGE